MQQNSRDGFETLPASPPTDAAMAAVFALVLDQIDYGLIVLGEGARLLHANGAARSTVVERHPLQLADGCLVARDERDRPALRKAFDGARQRGLRALVTLGSDADRAQIAIIPLPASGHPDGAVAMVALGRRSVCDSLASQWFARSHGLTLAESRVLELLCIGVGASAIAVKQGVAVSTIRTQIGSIRSKTGARNIGAVVRQVATMPPMVNALGAVNHARA